MKPNSAARHLEGIDVLRALAILLVIGYHFLPSITGQYEPGWQGCWRDIHSLQTPLSWLLYPLSLGWSGVSLFFVISGFCIQFSFLKHESRSPGKPFLKDFFWKRFWRIYPPYAVALVVFGFLLPLASTPPAAGSFLMHVLLIHNFSGSAFHGINPSFWSLAVEMQFYLLFPLVLWLRGKFGMKTVFWFFAAVSIGCRLATLGVQDWSQAPREHLTHFTLTLFLDWLLGAWLAERWLAGKRLFNANPAKVLVVGLLAVACSWNKVTMVLGGFTIFSLGFAMVMEMYLFSNRPVGSWAKLTMPVGMYSYSIYLWHQPLLGLVMRGLQHFGLPATPSASLIVMPVVVLLMIGLGWVSYHLLELPSIWLGKYLQLKPLPAVRETCPLPNGTTAQVM